MKTLTTTIAKYLYAIPFGLFGILHFMGAKNMAGMVPSFIPGGIFWIYLTGLALMAASVSLLTGIQTRLACILLAIMLGVFVLTIHLPGLGNEATMQMSMVSLLKDVALAGAALTYAGLAGKREIAVR